MITSASKPWIEVPVLRKAELDNMNGCIMSVQMPKSPGLILPSGSIDNVNF